MKTSRSIITQKLPLGSTIPVSNLSLFQLIIDLSLRTLEDMLVCKEKSQHLMQKNNEALL